MFLCADLTWPVLTWPDLSWFELTCPNLTWPILTWLDLTWLDWTWPVMTWPDLTHPYLTSPDLTSVDLAWPDLTCPKLTYPDLSCPDLTCSDLIQGNISEFQVIRCGGWVGGTVAQPMSRVDFNPIIMPLRGPTCKLKPCKISTQVEIASWARVWQKCDTWINKILEQLISTKYRLSDWSVDCDCVILDNFLSLYLI